MRPSCFTGDLGPQMSPKNSNSYSQFAVRRQFVHPAEEDTNFDLISGELENYDESVDHIDILTRINVLEYDKFKAIVDQSYNTGPSSKIEIEVPNTVRDLTYRDFWLIRNKENTIINLYKVIEITPRKTGGCVMDYVVELDIIVGVKVQTDYSI